MDKQLFVSVVVCTYNRKEMLVKCLDSLFNQTYPKNRYEVIIVNDGSTDGTEKVLGGYEKIASCKFKWFSQQNKGSATARNLGIQNAEGEIICLTDDDCIADRDWIKNMVCGYDCEGVGGVGGEIIGYKPTTLVERYVEKNRLLDQKVFISLFIVTANASYRRDILNRIKGFDSHIPRSGGEDVDIGIRTLLGGNSLGYMPKAVISHMHRSTFNGLLKQFYGYGRGYAFLHKKYVRYFNPDRRIKYLGCKILFKVITAPVRPFKAFSAGDKLLCVTEPLFDILLLSSELLGVISESLSGKEYPGEEIKQRVDVIEEADLNGGWGL